MAYIKICDLCGQPIGDNEARKYRIKQLKHHFDYFDGMSWTSWDEIDAHAECIDVLFNKAKEPTPPSGDTAMQDG